MKRIILSAIICVASFTSAIAAEENVIVVDQSGICGEDKGCAMHVQMGFFLTAQKFGERVGVIETCDQSVSRPDADCREVRRPNQPVSRFYMPKVN